MLLPQTPFPTAPYASCAVQTFTGTDGEVATITLNIDNDMKSGEYPVALKNILTVEADETRHSCIPVELTLSITDATSIVSLFENMEEETTIYNLAGQCVPNAHKGINIVHMSDGTTRKVQKR